MTEPPLERHDDLRQEAPLVSKQEAPLVESPATALQTEPPPEHHDDSKREAPLVSKQEAPLVENPATAPQDDRRKQTTSDNDSKKAFVFPSATANVRAYQAKLLEMAQADMQFSFEFAERLAAIRSPVEFPRVIAEFTGKRITMFMDHSKEMAELSTRRRKA